VAALRARNGESASLDRLAKPGTVAVVTGQQVGLFSGPAYTKVVELGRQGVNPRLPCRGRAKPGAGLGHRRPLGSWCSRASRYSKNIAVLFESYSDQLAARADAGLGEKLLDRILDCAF